jgi:hypothetical protein
MTKRTTSCWVRVVLGRLTQRRRPTRRERREKKERGAKPPNTKKRA